MQVSSDFAVGDSVSTKRREADQNVFKYGLQLVYQSMPRPLPGCEDSKDARTKTLRDMVTGMDFPSHLVIAGHLVDAEGEDHTISGLLCPLVCLLLLLICSSC
jgi:hypothetical protein